MILWTIQTEEVYKDILKNGKYICNPEKSTMKLLEFEDSYDWLVKQMRERIGNPPKNVTYPVWAWYVQNSKHKKPDLRSERWCNGKDGEKMVCLEIEVPDEQVLLSDFDLWHYVLNSWIISETEEESKRLEALYDSLSTEKQLEMKNENWKRIFDVEPFENDWISRGKRVQTVFWVLERDMIKKVRYFTSRKTKNNLSEICDDSIKPPAKESKLPL